MAMAFATPWVGKRFVAGSSAAKRPTCSTRMALVSHEKLETVFGDGDDEIAKYRLVLQIPGTYSRAQRKKSVDALKKNADFPGFRKGTIPPFIKKDVDSFVLRDSVDEMISEACVELGLKPIEGEKGGPKIDFEEMSERFKVGTDFEFECMIPLGKDAEDEDAKNIIEAEAVDAK